MQIVKIILIELIIILLLLDKLMYKVHSLMQTSQKHFRKPTEQIFIRNNIVGHKKGLTNWNGFSSLVIKIQAIHRNLVHLRRCTFLKNIVRLLWKVTTVLNSVSAFNFCKYADIVHYPQVKKRQVTKCSENTLPCKCHKAIAVFMWRVLKAVEMKRNYSQVT